MYVQADSASFLISRAFAKTIYTLKQNHTVQTRSGNHYLVSIFHYTYRCRGVAREGADQLTLLEPWGEDYARHTTASSPGFKMLSMYVQLCDEKKIVQRISE